MPESSGQPTVLVVEDEHDLRDLYAEWLSADYAVRTAPNGETAIAKLDETVDVVLLDRRMPGLSGDEVLEEIRDRPFACRVAMVTAVDPNVDIVEMGFDDYLVKPVSAADLSDTVERLLTRDTYDSAMQEYFSLLSKRAVLETEYDANELAHSTEYQTLQDRISELEAKTDDIGADLVDSDFESAIRDL